MTRYFGGILLGAGGLTRAYSKAASAAVKAAEIIEIRETVNVRITADYDKHNTVTALIKQAGGIIINEVFTDNVEIITAIPPENVHIIQENNYYFSKNAEIL